MDNKNKLFFVFLLLVLTIFSIQFTNAKIVCSAQTSCSDTAVLYVQNDTGGFTNAHAQNVSVGTYAYNVCCNADADGETVGVGCSDSGAATFLKLSATDNAHVEIPSLDNYTVDACISVTNKILSCDNYTGSCPENYGCVASIKSTEGANISNAHVDGNCSDDYSMKICCGYTGGVPTIISSRISSGTNYTNETLIGFCNATESNSNPVRYHYRWYKDTVLNISGTTSSTYAQAIEINVHNLTSPNTTKGDSWILGCLADNTESNSSWMNSTAVIILNSPPSNVTLLTPSDGNTSITNRTTTFNWTTAIDYDNDALQYEIVMGLNNTFLENVLFNVTNITTTNYTDTVERSSALYYWKVRAYDGTVLGAWSDTYNYTLGDYLSISLTTSSVDFGSLDPGITSNTTDDSPAPFDFLNKGNIQADLQNVTSTASLWQLQPLNTSYTQYQLRNVSNPPYNYAGSIVAWQNLSNSSPMIVDHFDWHSGNNTLDVDTYINVPAAEPPGPKSTSITFTWVEST